MTADQGEVELTRDEENEVKMTGYAHFRHAEGQPIKCMALLRAAALVMSETALDRPEPAQALEALIDELRDDALHLMALAMDVGADEPLN